MPVTAMVDHKNRFDLAALELELRREPAYHADGHTARTLIQAPDLHVVFVVMRGGVKIPEHHADHAASVQTYTGNLVVRLAGARADLPVGRILKIDQGLAHDVEALADSAFVLTLGGAPK